MKGVLGPSRNIRTGVGGAYRKPAKLRSGGFGASQGAASATSATIASGTAYGAQLILDGSQVSLSIDGAAMASHDFAVSVTGGRLGMGGRWGVDSI